MFRTRWLSNNRIIVGIFVVLAILNAYAMSHGYYR